MKLFLPAAILLTLAACSPPTPASVEEVKSPTTDPTQTAVTAYLKKTLDDPATYQPARWGKELAWQQ
jgi:hypothetical protein